MNNLYKGSLHGHTDASNMIGFYDSTTKVEDLVKYSFSLGHEFVAVTDHAIVMNHANLIKEVRKLNEWGKKGLQEQPQNPDFQRAAKFKAILGAEIYLSKEGQSRETHERGDRFYHLVLVAKDKKGWEQLNELVSIAWERSYVNFVRRIPNYISDFQEVIGEDKGHLVATTACLGGFIKQPIFDYYFTNDFSVQEKGKHNLYGFTRTMQNILGEENFFYELQPAMYEEQMAYNLGLVRASKELGVPLIAANDNHYLRERDRTVHATFLQSQNKGDREPELFYKYTYLMSSEEMAEKLLSHKIKDIEMPKEAVVEALSNTKTVMNMVEVYDIFHKPIIPYIPYEDMDKWEDVIHRYDEYEWWNKMSHSNNNDRFLVYRTILGFDDKIERGWFPKEDEYKAVEVMNTEFMHIMQISERLEQDISTYFTTMESMIEKIWEVSIVAPSRGSAGAFFINYALGITQVNPLEFNFPSERFLHRDKASLPDIDLDSGASTKSKMLQVIREWAKDFGGEITNIAAYSLIKSKSALQTAARGLGYSVEDGLYWGSLIVSSRGFDYTLDEMYYGNKEKGIKPDKTFVEEMNAFPEVFEVARELEGIISNATAHAAGIFVFNDSIYKHTATMKTSGGITITQVDLKIGEEDLGLTKYDLLSTDAMDSIQVTMMMLVQDGYMEWQGSLKATYEKYLRPEVIDYNNKEMWKNINEKKVLDLFQFLSAQVGNQAISLIQPQDLFELATINSVMRLMSVPGGKLPLLEYKDKKEDPNLWLEDARKANLTQEEIDLIDDLFAAENHMCVTQEALMKSLRDERLTGFSFLESDQARKIVGKKQMAKIGELKEKFLHHGRERGNRDEFLEYIWEHFYQVQMGYSFSQIHTVGYSIVALQEAWLATKYPTIYWSTSRLITESQSVDTLTDDLDIYGEMPEFEETDGKARSIDYFKIAKALGKIRNFGVDLQLPNLNESSGTFKPVVREDGSESIYFGLSGITRVSDNMVEQIIQNRPYYSVADIMRKIKPDKLQMSNLIKAGALDYMGEREDIMNEWLSMVANTKQRITLQNIRLIVELKIVPNDTEERKLANKIAYMGLIFSKHFKQESMLVPDEMGVQLLNEVGYPHLQYVDGYYMSDWQDWLNFRKTKIEPIREYIVENQEEVLQTINEHEFNIVKNKYAQGTYASWEMEALSFYYHTHELLEPEYQEWLVNTMKVVEFEDLPTDPVVTSTWINKSDGSVGRKFATYAIAGTAIGRSKAKGTVGILTTSGFVEVKLFKNMFNKYDRRINANGVTEDSWFKKGTKLILVGYRNAVDGFVLKNYKNSMYSTSIYKIVEPGVAFTNRLEAEEGV